VEKIANVRNIKKRWDYCEEKGVTPRANTCGGREDRQANKQRVGGTEKGGEHDGIGDHAVREIPPNHRASWKVSLFKEKRKSGAFPKSKLRGKTQKGGGMGIKGREREKMSRRIRSPARIGLYRRSGKHGITK